MEKTDPDLAFAPAVDLLDPALGRFSAGHPAPQTSDIEIDPFAQRARIRPRLWL
jgi:hypothetical protein